MTQCRYSDLNQDSSGKIVSGPSGSGVGIITTLLMVVATVIVVVKAVSKKQILARGPRCWTVGGTFARRLSDLAATTARRRTGIVLCYRVVEAVGLACEVVLDHER